MTRRHLNTTLAVLCIITMLGTVAYHMAHPYAERVLAERGWRVVDVPNGLYVTDGYRVSPTFRGEPRRKLLEWALVWIEKEQR